MTDQQKIEAFRESITMRLEGFKKMKPNPPSLAAAIPDLRMRIAQQVERLDEAETAITTGDQATARSLIQQVEDSIEEDTQTILEALKQDIEVKPAPVGDHSM